MMIGRRKEDPYLSFRFLLEVDGLIKGGFSQASGLEIEVETEDYQEGGVNEFVHKLLKSTKGPNLVLKRGITDCEKLWQWHQDIVNGKIERKKVRLIILDYEGNEKVHWEFKEAHPVKWIGPEFSGDSNAVAIEILELVHQGIQRV